MKGTVRRRTTAAGRARWEFVFDAGRDEDGRRRQLSKSGFATQRAAEDALREAIIEAGKESGDAPASPAFESFFKHWVEEHASRRCAPKTVERYGQLGAYAMKYLGRIPLQELTTAQIQQTVHRLADSGGAITEEFPRGRPLSAKSVRHVGTLLHTVLSDAVRLGHLAVNPMADARVILPKLAKRKPPVLDTAKIALMFNRARGTRTFAFVVLASASGCRRGELLALQWADINFDAGLMMVSKSLEQTKAGLRIKSTKSEEPREIGLPDHALDVLREHRIEQDRDRALYGESYEDRNLVFCQPNGAYYSPDRMGARVAELLRKAGLHGVSLHSLRHSHASILISEGVPIPVVSERLGHANQNITLSIYSHALPRDKRAAVNLWNKAIAESVEEERRAGGSGGLRAVSKCEREIPKVCYK
ncbi:MAG: tyrosine-type recombinase/integrase [Bryobacteraceae bacterium]